MADNTAEEILKRLQDLLATAGKTQARVIERYASIYQQLVRGDIGEADPAKWGDFWIEEANRFARKVTEMNATYAEAMLALGDEFVKRLESMVARKGDTIVPAGA